MRGHLTPRAVWLTLHEPRVVTIFFVAAYAVLAYGGLGILVTDHGQLPVGVWSGRMVSGSMFMIGGLLAAPMGWRGIWWAERIGIVGIVLGLAARILAILGMGDAYNEGHVVFALTAWVALACILAGRYVWVRVSPFRLGAGPLPPAVEATLARARIEQAEGRDA